MEKMEIFGVDEEKLERKLDEFEKLPVGETMLIARYGLYHGVSGDQWLPEFGFEIQKTSPGDTGIIGRYYRIVGDSWSTPIWNLSGHKLKQTFADIMLNLGS